MTTPPSLRARFAAAAACVGLGIAALALGAARYAQARLAEDGGADLYARPVVPAGGLLAPAIASLVVYLAIVASAAAILPTHHPHPRLGPATLITLFRAGLVAMGAALLAVPPAPAGAWVAILLMTTVAILDGVDGRLARRSALASAFGARFDMETDALAILVLSALVWQHGKAGPWVLGCGMMRYAFAGAGWVLPWMAAPLAPTWRGKTVAVAQYVGLQIALGPIVPSPSSDGVAAVTFTALAWSFAMDVRRLWRQRGAADVREPRQRRSGRTWGGRT